MITRNTWNWFPRPSLYALFQGCEVMSPGCHQGLAKCFSLANLENKMVLFIITASSY